MSAEQVLGNLMAYTKLRNEYLNESLEVISSSTTRSQALATVLLVIIAFISLALAFINKNGSAVKYFSSAVVASGSIALGSVYLCNFFGVYI